MGNINVNARDHGLPAQSGIGTSKPTGAEPAFFSRPQEWQVQRYDVENNAAVDVAEAPVINAPTLKYQVALEGGASNRDVYAPVITEDYIAVTGATNLPERLEVINRDSQSVILQSSDLPEDYGGSVTLAMMSSVKDPNERFLVASGINGDFDGIISVINLSEGEIVWTYEQPNTPFPRGFAAVPDSDDVTPGVFYMTGGKENDIKKFNPATGEVLWSGVDVNPGANLNCRAPVYFDESIYVLGGGSIAKLDAETGQLAFDNTNIPVSIANNNGTYKMAFTSQGIFAGDADGQIEVLSINDGTRQAVYSDGNARFDDNQVTAGETATNGVMGLASRSVGGAATGDPGLHSVDPQGNLNWRRGNLQVGFHAGATISGDRIYVPDGNDLKCLDAADGSDIWTLTDPNSSVGTVATSNTRGGVLAFITTDNILYVYE